ncbi:MAG: DUF1294 domain-containing protein, partial [Clostridiales bacterium]|nr:DUF1294 domain-containing protein [Clostridiales bacterium]
MQYLWGYLGIINLIAVILALLDKRAANRRRRRVKERTLLLVSFLGGSIAMLLTMLSIRHKTKKAKFMLGIPVIIALQLIAAAAIF